MQEPAYKISIKNGRNWRDYRTARLEISVGQPYHEGDKFYAVCDFAAKNFDRVIVDVADTLQRHNHALEEGDFWAWTKTRSAGDQWIARNSEALALLPNCDIQRWEMWLSHPEYPRALAQMVELYKTIPSLKAELNRTVDSFLARNTQSKHSLSDLRHKSLSYLLEEAAVAILQNEAEQAVDIYPGTPMEFLNTLHGVDSGLVPEALKRRHPTRVYFTRRSQFVQHDMCHPAPVGGKACQLK